MSEAPATDDLVWHRVHPVTPLVRGWTVIAVLLVVVGQQTLNGLPEGQNLLEGDRWWMILLGILVVGLVGLGYSALAWRMTSYAVDDESVHLRTGVLFRQQRKARLDRLQAVDVVQPLLARFFGLAELKLEVAGGADSGVKLGFLKEAEANRLRNDLLARAAGLRVARERPAGVPTAEGASGVVRATPDGTAGVAPDVAPGTAAEGLLVAPEAPEQPVTAVAPGRLVASLLRSGATVGLVLGVLGIAGVVIGTREIGVLFSALPAVLGFGGFLFSRFTGEFGFRSAISPDGIRLRHGLLETRSQTIPPGRVQAVRLRQGPFWRGPDWWRVDVNVAGYGMSTDGSATTSVLLPVGTRDEALAALWLVLPDLGTSDPRALLDEGLSGLDAGEHFTVTPRRARLLDPVSWRRNGFTVTERALVLRGGRVFRSLVVVPHERTQSLGLEQGPLQRRFDVATFAVHSTPGPVSPKVWHLDSGDAARLLDTQAARAREARAHAGPELWMRRDDVPLATASAAAAEPRPAPGAGPDGPPAADGERQ
ncbi:PH domain-containing protein [Cellulosimicrobium cellulans]|uniref:PH domain-containing protein n=1 Tax=Cellulosimicrobium cellulans TaxID=1710 RepID=UPI0019640DF4|nr:PH domain-containing protein [Cellulosimicrobium cellulans]MBN0041937.1 PH domain-containing protein [Cellulosimicrobium cellulans]